MFVTLSGGIALSQPAPSFEVASIRMNKDVRAKMDLEFAPGGERFAATGAPLNLLIVTAYGIAIPQYDAEKSLASVLSERYDVQAKAGHPVGRSEMLRMLQALLVERFQLKIHRETKELDAYVLVIDKEGRKKVSQLHASGVPHPDAAAPLNPLHARGAEPSGGYLVFKDETMTDFAWRLSTLQVLAGKVVVDRTGLDQHYDFELRYGRDLAGPAAGAANEASPGDAPSIFTAVREQLGLRLVPQKLPIEILKVERAERPSEN